MPFKKNRLNYKLQSKNQSKHKLLVKKYNYKINSLQCKLRECSLINNNIQENYNNLKN
jgi:hypothetical protein